jgi:asparagine synthase (glutamine-hydrolysing)
MSRIAGILGTAPHSSAAVARMLRFQAPSQGTPAQVDGSMASIGWVGRGHHGLAEEGPLILSFDGVIFNRKELDGAEETDAELLAKLVARRGLAEALARVNGDFAVAVVDRDRGTLQLARDRVGAKPIYYALVPQGVAFASRCGALLGVQGISAEPNRRFAAVFAGSHYRSIDNVPEESPYRDIAQVPAATIVTLSEGSKVNSSRYWDLKPTASTARGETELAERYRSLLLDAVARRVARSERPAFTLSGGLDSSSVLSCAVEALGRTQHAFSTVYSDATFDESAEIHSMLDTKVAEWHRVVVDDPPVLPLVREMIQLHDEPVATSTWLSHYVLVRDVGKAGFATLFGGLGGDELNAGEYEYFIFHFADLRAARDPSLDAEIREWQRHHDHPLYRKGPAEAEAQMAAFTDPTRRGHVRVNLARMRRYFGTINRDWYDLEHFTHVNEHPFDSWLLNRTYQDIFRETAPCCLRAEDRHTAALGVQRFDPFFDHNLMEFMFTVPSTLKIRDGVTKRLLRTAMTGILPEETRLRVKKTGWNSPAHRWFSQGRNLEDLQDLVSSQSFRERGLYDPAAASRLIDEHREIVATGRLAENHMMFLWQLVNVETWLASITQIARAARGAS